MIWNVRAIDGDEKAIDGANERGKEDSNEFHGLLYGMIKSVVEGN